MMMSWRGRDREFVSLGFHKSLDLQIFLKVRGRESGKVRRREGNSR